jgi:NAD(P)-dependent dehydrogenase (short-subunit alcohol dehydrogenase family)
MHAASCFTSFIVANSRRIQHLVKNLAVELGPRHILVNAIAPGFFPSKMTHGLLEATGGVEALGKANPSGRLGEAEDIAGAVVYMASRAGSHLNGAVLAIDGGEHLARGKL